MKHTNISIFFTTFIIIISFLSLSPSSCSSKSSIIFTTLGRSSYNFDIYAAPISKLSNPTELKLTDGISVSFNGHFPNKSSTPVESILSLQTTKPNSRSSLSSLQLVYVTERGGKSGIYFDAIDVDVSVLSGRTGSGNKVRSALELEETDRVQVELVKGEGDGVDADRVVMMDRPSLLGENLVYVSTLEDTGEARTSWTAVYLTHVPTGSTRRLTPKGIADFSPAVSPSGLWTAVASYGEGKNWNGEVQELDTDIYIFLTQDGSNRVKVVEHGGWPCWADDNIIYFHRRSKDDGWWSVYRATIPQVGEVGEVSIASVVVERVTPPGFHAFTPATSPGNKDFIALATRRPGSDYRHIELFDLKRKEFKEVTKPISPNTHHLNPFISPDSTVVAYHKCRGVGDNGEKRGADHLLLENLKIPESEISIFRIDGSFPSFSPSGDRIAYVKMPGLYVVNHDGSNLRKVFEGMAFSTAWNPVQRGVVYTSVGPTFASESTNVDVIAINVDDEELSYRKLTHGGENNAFPSPSPDGKWIVFRSGRSGHKNLYIMDAEQGEDGGLQRLTEGPWSDTMANWSPDGEWIVFASDRSIPGSGSFELFMIHPNGTGLHEVLKSGSSGRTNHPWFSPDGKKIVFTSDFAGVSAEPISNPHHYQPYGDIFIANVDGSGIQRMTHNSYEDGTPSWGPRFLNPVDVPLPTDGPGCDFADCHWLNIEPKKIAVEVSPGASSKVQC